MSDLLHGWWDGDKSVRIYADGTVEIQSGEHAYRATPGMWTRAAIELNYSVSHCQASLIDSVPAKVSI